jgi:hypothetical protein
MNEKEDNSLSGRFELDDYEKISIAELFDEIIVPKLRSLHARIGAVSCDFAGQEYKNWIIHFKSRGEYFDIVDFEYDEEACSFDLDL